MYGQRDNPAFEACLAAMRTTAKDAALFVPYLRPGMQVLDVGSGPGSITVGLAEAVAPGEVVGMDMQQLQVERASVLAAERGVRNARFEVGDAYRLPFPDGSFDAAFANAVIFHLNEPVRALAEMRRVLRPRGIAAVNDPDFVTVLFTPATPLLEQWLALVIRVLQHNGGDPFWARHLRSLFFTLTYCEAVGWTGD